MIIVPDTKKTQENAIFVNSVISQRKASAFYLIRITSNQDTKST